MEVMMQRLAVKIIILVLFLLFFLSVIKQIIIEYLSCIQGYGCQED